jgi:hypothetical protein
VEIEHGAVPNSLSWRAGAVILSLVAVGCVGEVRYSKTPELLPSEPLHYVIVKAAAAPEPHTVSAEEWARSRFGRFRLWSVASTQLENASWVVADLGVTAIAEKIEVAQMLNAVEGYREPLHVVVWARGHPPPLYRAGFDTPAHCSIRSVISRNYDLDCELAGLSPLIAADWVEELSFYKPGWVRWK